MKRYLVLLTDKRQKFLFGLDLFVVSLLSNGQMSWKLCHHNEQKMKAEAALRAM